MTLAPELCRTCGHEWDPHELQTMCDPPYHGWITCPVEGCECFSSWAVPGAGEASAKCADPACNYDVVLEIAERAAS